MFFILGTVDLAATERNRLEADARRIAAEIAVEMGDGGDRVDETPGAGEDRVVATPGGDQDKPEEEVERSQRPNASEAQEKGKPRSKSGSSSKKSKRSKRKKRRRSSTTSSSSSEEETRKSKRKPTSQKLKRDQWPADHDTDDMDALTYMEALAMKDREDKLLKKDRENYPGVRVARKEAKIKQISIPAGIDDGDENLHMAR